MKLPEPDTIDIPEQSNFVQLTELSRKEEAHNILVLDDIKQKSANVGGISSWRDLDRSLKRLFTRLLVDQGLLMEDMTGFYQHCFKHNKTVTAWSSGWIEGAPPATPNHN